MSVELYRLTPGRCALMVVDIQENLMRVIDNRDQVARNSALLAKAAAVLKIPVIATTQYVARIGPLLPEVTAELAGVEPLDKVEFDCFGNQVIAEAVRGLGPTVDTLVVCGVETHICIYQTVVGALMAGYRVWVPADGVSSRLAGNKVSGLDRIRQVGGVVANTEMIIYDWLRKAGTPEFKALLPFLK
ncbi:MAG: isochorismatase family protein [Desulfobulbaceae bacterium]|nr:isochorismatase family protein [Desulfobulbaceae bacterium]